MKYGLVPAIMITTNVLTAPAAAQAEKLTMEEAVAIALAAQPGTVAEAEADEFEGRAVADIEIVNSAGEEIEFKVDLMTGEILNVWTDDDPTDDPASATLENTTFLIPGHNGGGWDTTTRAIGEAFLSAGVAEGLVFDNKDGNNGGVGLAHMIDNADTLPNTLMLNTTQIMVRSLNGTYTHSYDDLVPIAATLADFATLIVHPGSDLLTMEDLMAAYQNDDTGFAIGGGSATNGIDHLISALVIDAAGADPTFTYVQFDAAEPAFAALVAGQVTALTTEYSQALALSQQGVARILGVTAPEEYPLEDGIPSMHDQGIEMDFITWTGFFAAPATSKGVVEGYDAAFAALYQTSVWADAVAANGWIEVRANAELFAEHLEGQHDQIIGILEQLGDG